MLILVNTNEFIWHYLEYSAYSAKHNKLKLINLGKLAQLNENISMGLMTSYLKTTSVSGRGQCAHLSTESI